jgi:hypothetical protein
MSGTAHGGCSWDRSAKVQTTYAVTISLGTLYERTVTDITGPNGTRQYGVFVKATSKNKEKGGMLCLFTCKAKKRTVRVRLLVWHRKSLTRLEF